ncbi:MAG: hypothetical protein GXO75_10700 [Calditrichaeota bacterium]|nr:hypothetical protein [Calditrichota bacterium]
MKRRDVLQALALVTGNLSLEREKVFTGSIKGATLEQNLSALQSLLPGL